jgi:hypothetical protein
MIRKKNEAMKDKAKYKTEGEGLTIDELVELNLQ